MASKRDNQLFDKKSEYAICGYIRENFDKKCWIDEIVATIIQFYMIKGGSLYVCGDGQYGRLGIEKYKNDSCKTLTLCPPFIENNAHKVSLSTFHTLVVDKDGDVWCCGLGRNGALGNGKTNNLYVPTKLNLGIRVIEVSAGKYHSLLLCENGTMKGCGSNAFGQIGLGELKETLVPKTIEKLQKYKVIQICAGCNYTAALTEDGVLFCFGDSWNGQCGVGKENGEYIMTPTKVDLDDEIEFVECGNNHTLVISCKGLIYSFGWGFKGASGHGNEENKYVPTLIEALEEKRIKMCAAGSYHSLCIDKEGIIWSFGWNGSGQCGSSGDIEIQKIPKVIDWFVQNNIKAKECAASDYTSSIIAHDRTLYVFGSNYNYQLGLGEKRIYCTPTKLCIPHNMAVQSVSMGECRSAIICDAM